MSRIILGISCLGAMTMSTFADQVPATVVGGTQIDYSYYYGWDYDQESSDSYSLTDSPNGYTGQYSSWSVSDESISFQASYDIYNYDTYNWDTGYSNGYAESGHGGSFVIDIAAIEAFSLTGWGNMMYRVFDDAGDQILEGMTGDLAGLQLGAGQWTLRLLGSSSYANGGSFSYTDDWGYDYWGDDYDAEGGFDITAVPAPSALALLGLSGLAARRRRR
tara:strand:+ start:1308 stop:1964 length:657 start_codon:yes stop_codon:yes gene_type:complete